MMQECKDSFHGACAPTWAFSSTRPSLSHNTVAKIREMRGLRGDAGMAQLHEYADLFDEVCSRGVPPRAQDGEQGALQHLAEQIQLGLQAAVAAAVAAAVFGTHRSRMALRGLCWCALCIVGIAKCTAYVHVVVIGSRWRVSARAAKRVEMRMQEHKRVSMRGMVNVTLYHAHALKTPNMSASVQHNTYLRHVHGGTRDDAAAGVIVPQLGPSWTRATSALAGRCLRRFRRHTSKQPASTHVRDM
jgi:hypothetical protein